MTHSTISSIAQKITKTHSKFAGKDVSCTMDILDTFEKQIHRISAMVGATFEAHTNSDFGDMDTFITINILEDGRWEYIESTVYQE